MAASIAHISAGCENGENFNLNQFLVYKNELFLYLLLNNIMVRFTLESRYGKHFANQMSEPNRRNHVQRHLGQATTAGPKASGRQTAATTEEVTAHSGQVTSSGRILTDAASFFSTTPRGVTDARKS
jgi:hypothetical protein